MQYIYNIGGIQMRNFLKRMAATLVIIDLILITQLLIQIVTTNAYNEQKVIETVNIKISENTLVNEISTINGYNKMDYVYTTDYSNMYKGSCAPVAVSNIMNYYSKNTGKKIVMKNKVTDEQFIQIATNLKTDINGGTLISNLKEGIEKSFEDYNVEIDLRVIRFNLWETIVKEIDNQRPLLLASAEEKIEHAYIVVGYIVIDEDTKAVITFTGWKDNPYRIMGINQDEQFYYQIKY